MAHAHHGFSGSYRESAPAYASSAVLATKEAYATEAVRFKSEGWTAYKIHPPTDPAVDIEVCHAVRRAVGDDFMVMLDSTWAYQYPEALRVGKVVEGLGFYWYEDPLADDDLLSYVKLKQHLCKTVSLSKFGDSSTGEVSHRELRVVTAPRLADSGNFDFDKPTHTWSCQDEELDRLKEFLNKEDTPPGIYRLVEKDNPAATIADLIDNANLDINGLASALAASGKIEDLLKFIVSTEVGETAAEAAIQAQRRRLVHELKQLALAPGTTETQMHTLIGNAYWLFGGQYIGIARRDLAKLDQHDLPLIGADRTLHLVELKGPSIPRLIRQHRNHWIVGNDVHEAVSQSINYLRALDEQGPLLESTYRNEFGEEWDLRRAHATVVVGHPCHVVGDGVTERLVEQVIRSYNAQLSRVQVVTYKSLFDAADRALRFADIH